MDDLKTATVRLQKAYMNEFDTFCSRRMKEEYQKRKLNENTVIHKEKKYLEKIIKIIRKIL